MFHNGFLFYVRKPIPQAHVALRQPYVRPIKPAPLVGTTLDVFRGHARLHADLTVAVAEYDRYRPGGLPRRGSRQHNLILI